MGPAGAIISLMCTGIFRTKLSEMSGTLVEPVGVTRTLLWLSKPVVCNVGFNM